MENPLKCPNCSDYRLLDIRGVRIEKDNKIIGVKVPFFQCPTCGNSEPLKSQNYYLDIANSAFVELKSGEWTSIPTDNSEIIFDQFDHLGFNYASEDYYNIPGLYRPEDDGYLTPVFFNKDVLIHYNNHPDYSVKLTSFSSGNIFKKNTTLFKYGFGINRNDKLFMWLGDLNKDLKIKTESSHLKRFQASNVKSDHDIYSKFYLSQIPTNLEDAFQEPDNEAKIFNLVNKFESQIHIIDDFKIYKININNLSSNYKSPILNERAQIFNSYTNLNIYIIENLQKKEMKKILKEADHTSIKKLQEIKTFELFLKEIHNINDIREIISPLYILNDLRQLNSHLSIDNFEDEYKYCKSRLSLPENCSDFEVYQQLISKLIDFYEVIVERICS